MDDRLHRTAWANEIHDTRGVSS